MASVSISSSIPPLFLASGSAQRRQLLAQLGLHVADQYAPDVDEQRFPSEPLSDYVCRITRLKAVAGQRHFVHGCIVAADTAMSCQGHVLGKPRDGVDAIAMLMQLSDCTHKVMTAVSVAGAKGILDIVVEAAVTFRKLSYREAEAYWQTGEPVGKAGSYALQGRGAQFVTQITGSPSAVMGLPLAETAMLLRQQGIDPLA